MWKKTETDPPPASPSSPIRKSQISAPGRELAFIGPSITIQGDVTGEENLRVDGCIEGKISLEKHNVTVGRSGRIKADIHGRHIQVEGEVKGNLYGEEEVILCESGKMEGNITAPQVSLEKGSTFRGSIDMSPRSSSRSGGRGSEKPSVGGSSSPHSATSSESSDS